MNEFAPTGGPKGDKARAEGFFWKGGARLPRKRRKLGGR